MRSGVVTALLAIAACSELRAQTCYHARPLPGCRALVLTNTGGYFNVMGRGGGTRRWRATVDWGVMVNTSPRDAVGASWFVSFDEDEFATGPVVRYRRWLGAKGALDLAIATPLSTDQLQVGSVLGLIKYSPEHWVGLAVRPEYARRDVLTCPGTCTQRTVSTGQVYVGLELGWYPGLTLSVGGGLVAGLLISALAGTN